MTVDWMLNMKFDVTKEKSIREMMKIQNNLNRVLANKCCVLAATHGKEMEKHGRGHEFGGLRGDNYWFVRR